MPLPPNVDTVTLVGTYTNSNGDPASGRIKIDPLPLYWLDQSSDPPTTIVGESQTVYLDETGSFSVDVVATDNADLNPIDWTYRITVNLEPPATKYSFYIEAPAGPDIDITIATPVAYSGGIYITNSVSDGEQGPPGPAGIIIDDEPPESADVLWADTNTIGIEPSMTVAVFVYTDPVDERPNASVVFWIPDPYDLANPFGALAGDCVLRSTPNVISSATGLTHAEYYTAAEYDAIAAPDPNTIYFVLEDPLP